MNKEINYSFIIPHHNTPDLLKRLVKSIPQRNDVEIIIVDDNSDEDKKANVVRDDVSIFYIDKDHTKGAGRARNVGLEHAIGKWLIFADADDFFSDTISKLLDSHKDSDHDIIYFKATGRNSDTSKPVSRGLKYNIYLDKFKNKRNKISEDMLRYRHVIPWCKIIRRSLVTVHNIKFEEVKYSNDVMFVTQAAFHARNIDISNIAAYNVTVRSGSLMTQITPESRRCRYDVKMRRMRFLWDNHKWRMAHPVIRPLLSILKRYGFQEFKVYTKIMRKNGIGWKHVIISEILYKCLGIYRYYFYEK